MLYNMIALRLYTLALLSFDDHAAAQGRRLRFEPFPMCSDCVPREDILVPGVGFDLTTSYATAAIRYYNGSLENLGKVRDAWRHESETRMLTFTR
jgi:hypothetical protein